MTKVSIRSMFEAQKTELEQKLKGLALPKDSIKVQETIEDLMNHLLDIDGEFRQGLTQSEDFILQSALRVLTIQQDLTNRTFHENCWRGIGFSPNISLSNVNRNRSGSCCRWPYW